MKPGLMLSAAALALVSLPLAAQQADATVAQGANASPAGVAARQSTDASVNAGPTSAQAGGSATANAEMRPVNTELIGKLDSKSAKAGDAVIVKTTSKVSTADGIVVPKGTRLIGHVASVQARGAGQAGSALSLVFDRAELKGGQSVAIRSVIETVAPPASAVAAASADSDSSMAMPAPMGGGRAGGGGRLGGGLVGGSLGATNSVAGGAASSLGATSGGPISGLGSTSSSAVHSTNAVTGDATTVASGGVRGTAGLSDSLAAHATGIPGVMLAGDAAGSASGTLAASGKNVHLDSGTQMVMEISGVVR